MGQPLSGTCVTIRGLSCLGALVLFLPIGCSQSAEGTGTNESAVSNAQSTFFSVTPKRLLDTRDSSAVGEGREVCVTVVAGEVPSGASAISMNLTVTEPTASGFLTAYPAGTARPKVSNVNFVANQTVANAAIVPIGANGQICVYNSAGASHVLVDRSGYFSPSDSGAKFFAIPPTRLLDSRESAGPPLASMTSTTVSGVGRGIPADATAAIVNITATEVQSNGYLSAYPLGGAVPVVSNLNVTTGDTRANLAIVEVRGGKFTLLNQASTHVVVDAVGYFAKSGTGGGALIPISPIRAYDSRDSGKKMRQGEARAIQFRTSAMPFGGAVLLNLTATEPSKSGYLTVGATSGVASTLNFSAGETVPNLAPTWVTNDGRGYVYNIFGSTHVIADVFGVFTSAPNANPPAIPALPATPLQDAVNSLVAELPTRTPGTVMSIAAYDFATNEHAASAETTPQVSASSAKAIWVAAAIDGAGASAVEPYAFPVFANSDNFASGSVIDLIGINRVNDYYRKIGLTSSAITNWGFGKPRSATNSPRALGADNYFTARDVITFLKGIKLATALRSEDAAILQKWMLASPRTGGAGGWLGTLLSPAMRSTMMHKAGWLPPGCCSSEPLYNTLNEIGLVEVEPGHWIAVAILLHGGQDYWGRQSPFMERASCVLANTAANAALNCRD